MGLRDVVLREWRELATINPSDRPWQMPFAAAASSGLSVVVGVASGHMIEGVIASLGALTFLYLPATALHHRMGMLLACSFGMVTCYSLGMFGAFAPAARVPLIGIATMLATMVARYYRLGPPGGLFFVMAAAIGAYSPQSLPDIPMRVGLIALGAMGACAVALVYSAYILSRRPAAPMPPSPVAEFERVWLDSVVIGVFVAMSLGIAQILGLEKPYWVPVSCLAIIQGMSIRAAWNRQVHRILGTAIGLAFAAALLSVVDTPWAVAAGIIVLTFLIETAVVRHYGFAVIFITPLALLLAEAPTLGHADIGGLITARFLDTVVGSIMGFLGAMCLHNPNARLRMGGWLRRILPARLIESDERSVVTVGSHDFPLSTDKPGIQKRDM